MATFGAHLVVMRSGPSAFFQEGGGPDFQNFPEVQFGKSNTQETRSSEVLEKELEFQASHVSGALITWTLWQREKVRTLKEP